VAVINTVYENPIILPPKVAYGKNIAIVGTSTKGLLYNPVYVSTLQEAKRFFGEGDLVDAYEEVSLGGGKYIYFVRMEDLSSDSFTKALEVIQDYPIHIVVPVGIFFDDEGYAKILSAHCANKNPYGECIGVMGVTPFPSIVKFDREEEESVLDYCQRVDPLIEEKVNNLYFNNLANSGFGDSGVYLNVVFAEVLADVGSSIRFVSGHTIYAGLLASLNPGVSPVNKSLPGAERLRFKLKEGLRKTEKVSLTAVPFKLNRRPVSKLQVVSQDVTPVVYKEGFDYIVGYEEGTIALAAGSNISEEVNITYVYDDHVALSSVGFVTFREFVKNGISPASSVTMSKSDLRHVQDLRIMQDIGWFIRELSNNLVGSSSVGARTISTLETEIKKYLDLKRKASKIVFYDLYIRQTDNFRNLEVHLDIELRDSLRLHDVVVRMLLAR